MTDDMIRDFCPQCAIKHLAQAGVLFKEYRKGYPHHIWYGLGHMAEAEDEIIEFMPEEANAIREVRKAIEADTTTQSAVAEALLSLMYTIAEEAMLPGLEEELLTGAGVRA